MLVHPGEQLLGEESSDRPTIKRGRAVVLPERNARHGGYSVDVRKAKDEERGALQRGLPRPADEPSSSTDEIEGPDDRQ